MKGDYSQPGDPYGIAAEYSNQSAAEAPTAPKPNIGDPRGNTVCKPRGLPTQEECDRIKNEGAA